MSFHALVPARRLRLLVLACGAMCAASCDMEFKGGRGEFELSKQTRESLDADTHDALERQLVRLFGTAQAPRSAGPERANLAESAKLYGQKCLHCHGNEGGGDGVTSHSLNPVPRDFRRGVFKYHAQRHGARPELADLERVITDGLDGAAMPSFRTLTQSQIEGLAEFTRYLAMRGEVEHLLVAEHDEGASFSDEDANEAYEHVVGEWLATKREPLIVPAAPPATAERIARGFELFHDTSRTHCASCHGPAGRGPGPAVFGPSPDDPAQPIPLLYDIWGHPALPRDLRSERFLHGSGPEDVYARIYLGIHGTPMAGIGDTLAANGARFFSDEDLWALAHYVGALRDPKWSQVCEQLESQLP